MSTNIPITSTGLIPAITKDYLQQKDVLKPFYKYAPNIDSFGEAIKNKHFNAENRNVLLDALLNQYKNAGIDLGDSEATHLNTLSLKNTNTFTVTTGHQLALFTGPLYGITYFLLESSLAPRPEVFGIQLLLGTSKTEFPVQLHNPFSKRELP